MYFGEMLPTFTRIKDTAQEIISINQDAMVKADRDARELSARSTRYMILASALGMAAAIFFAVRLQKAILQPIEALTAVSRELGEGKLDQVVPVESHDELGQLADAFNKMATKLRSYRQATSDQILQARQMTEITLSAFPDPILAFSPEGRITFTNPAANRLQRNLARTAPACPLLCWRRSSSYSKGRQTISRKASRRRSWSESTIRKNFCCLASSACATKPTGFSERPSCFRT